MKTNRNELEFPLHRVKAIIAKWLSLEDDRIIEVMLAVIVANQLQTDPNWLLLIGPPSHAKTELLRSLDGHSKAYFLSNLTPATLVSGVKQKKGQENPSLIFKLDSKTVVLKDFTTVLSMRSENQAEILSQLREIYDGQYSKAFGNGIVVDWKGHVGLIGAVTPVYDKHYAVIGSLGDRFLLYRTGNSDGQAVGLQAQKIVGYEDKMRTEIREAVHKFLDQFNDLGNIQFQNNDTVNHMIVDLACFVAYGRCPVERDYRNQNIQYLPMPEGTPRLVKQFMQVGMGLGLINGKQAIDLAVYETIKKIGRDLLPAHRLKILKHLYDQNVFEYMGEWQKTKDIADQVNIPASTTKIALEDLMIVGVLNRSVDGDSERSPYKWQINEKAYNMINKSEVFEVSKGIPF